MSYCRFSEADAYIFWSCAIGHEGHENYLPSAVECCSCALMPELPSGFHRSYRAPSFTAMLEHVAAHREAGHDIPLDVDEELRQDRDTYADDPTREVVS